MNANDHGWVFENLESYCAGGLSGSERERVAAHIDQCQECRSSLLAASRLDQAVSDLFLDAQPDGALEDRLIRSLRERGRPRLRLRGYGLAAAAAVLVAALGLMMHALIQNGNLPFPAELLDGTRRLFELADAATPPTSLAASPGSREKSAGRSSWSESTVQLSGAYGKHAPRAPTWEAQSGERLEDGPVTTGLSAKTDSWHAPGFDTKRRAADSEPNEATKLHMESLPEGDRKDHKSADGALTHYYSYANQQLSIPPIVAAMSADGKSLASAQYGQALGLRGMAAEAKGDKRDGQVNTLSDLAYTAAGGATVKEKDALALRQLQEGRVSGVEAKKPGAPLDSPQNKAGVGTPANTAAPAVSAVRKIIIRSGDIEFEIESFDAAVATVTKLVLAIPGAFVATVNSEKLPNGKVRGSATVRVPPDNLDGLVLDLRKELGRMGELKGQKIGSQDITKQYTDIESRLRAARAMEERLLNVIKLGKGEIKDLLQAEKELGVWRTKIEEMEGEIRYYNNLVSLSTLTITLVEKEIRSPFATIETERVQMGIEVEDVDKAQQAVIKDVTEAKGRVTKSEVKRQAEGQFQSLITFEVPPDASGPLRDRLKQLGNVTRLDIVRAQESEGGSGKPRDGKTKRNDSQYILSLYNIATAVPRETVQLNLACTDADASFQKVVSRVQKTTGRIVTSNLSRVRNDQTTGTIQFEVPTAIADAILQELKAEGDVLKLQIVENAQAQGTTQSKRGFLVQLWALGQVAPRETSTIRLAAADVAKAYRSLVETVLKAKGRILASKLNEQDRQNVTAQLDFDMRRDQSGEVETALAGQGDIYHRTVDRAPDADNVLDSKVLYRVSFINLSKVGPRESIVLEIEAKNVDSVLAAVTAIAQGGDARLTDSNVSYGRTGKVTAKLIFELPLAGAPAFAEKIKKLGITRLEQASRNTQVPESKLSLAQVTLTLTNEELIVPSDEGLWQQIRRGLYTSFVALSWSLIVVIVGVCFVLPWTVAYLGVRRLVRRFRGTPTPSAG